MIFCLQEADLLTVDKTQLFFSNKRKDAFYGKTMTFVKIIYSNEFVTMNGVFFQVGAFSNDNVAVFEEKIREMYDNELKSSTCGSSNHRLSNSHSSSGGNVVSADGYRGGGGGQRSTMMWRKKWKHISFLDNAAAYGDDHVDNYRETRKRILKITGIWENDTHYGCSYKLFSCSLMNEVCVK